uniref:DUF627 domain-containing protein n=1 Tax=Brassica oleracea TaxID=3712 RepID=A0A3P6BM92_BRAOL|nr:unnamed protein product [Brassica oleracea]
MGQKKKPPAPRSKQSLSSSAAEAEPSSEVSACTSYDGDEPSNLAEIKVECEKALTSFRRGSYNKAIRLMKESCSRHQHSALIHRVQGTVCVKVSSVYEDAVTKQKYIRSAIESARKAVELSPNSIEFAHFMLTCFTRLLAMVESTRRFCRSVTEPSPLRINRSC